MDTILKLKQLFTTWSPDTILISNIQSISSNIILYIPDFNSIKPIDLHQPVSGHSDYDELIKHLPKSLSIKPADKIISIL